MTTSAGRAEYASVDVELFDLDHVAHTTDQRSVGELLFDADRRARLLLIDVSEDDVAQLLHAWPTLVSAAVNLWQALPHTPAQFTDSATAIDRVAQIGQRISLQLTTSSWPPATGPDPRLREMTNTLDQATSLVRRFADRTPLSDSARDDIHAARARIMHSLYVATHAVTVSLLQHGRTVRDHAAQNRRPLATPTHQTPYAVAPTTAWVRRMSAAEAAAASFAPHGRLPALLNSEHRISPTDTSRLARALAHWDVHAHRGLASPEWHDNMVLISRTQALITGTAMVLAAAAEGASLDLSPRLRPALDRAGTAWNDLGSRWDDLTPPHVRPSPHLLVAAGEIRAATRDLTHDGATMATRDTIASRPGLHDGLQAVLHALVHADELAHAVAEKSATPGLTGRARALSIRAQNDIEAGRVAAESDVVWVSPTDILGKHTVAAPPPVTEGLTASSEAVVRATTAAGAVASSSHSALMATRRDQPSPPAPTQRAAQHQLSTGCTDRPPPHGPHR
ncbi:hypothetical protein GCM10023339_41530 [Alloalcanivorax gelatiniphagus]